MVHEPATIESKASAALSTTAAKHILVIDDDVHVLDSMRLLLTSWQHQVYAAASLEQALQIVAQHQAQGQPAFDLILSDFRLAENVSGIDVVQAVRQASGRDIPAVMITGDTSVESINRITGAHLRILHKPLDPEKLHDLLRDLH